MLDRPERRTVRNAIRRRMPDIIGYVDITLRHRKVAMANMLQQI
ncbi:MAG: hypothetical protein ACLQUZ_05545 [Rhizomicrobium sp.]